MRYRRRLRSRIILSFFLFGFGLTALFAAATVLLRERLEDQLIGEALFENVEDYAQQFYEDPDNTDVLFEKIWGITYSKRRFGNVPFNWRDLPDGIHELTDTDDRGRTRTYKLAVKKDEEFWFFLTYDISQERTSQQLALDGDVGDTTSLTHDTRHCTQHDWYGQNQSSSGNEGDRHRLFDYLRSVAAIKGREPL